MSDKMQRVWWVVMLDNEADGSIDPSSWGCGVDESDQFATEAEAIAAAKEQVDGFDEADASTTVYRVEAVANVTRKLSPPRVNRLDGKKGGRQ